MKSSVMITAIVASSALAAPRANAGDNDPLIQLPFLAPKAAARNNDNLIQKNRVGAIAIDMPINQLRRVVPSSKLKDHSIMAEGVEYPGFVLLTAKKEHGLIIEITEHKVSRINVVHPSYKTAAGVGVRSSMAELRKAYPNGVEGSLDCSGLPTYTVTEIRAIFVFNHSETGKISDNDKVTKIRL